ncbi:MAG: hypothetical protein KF851_05765 [Pirellulaceae bacterium]|nr:hypothetical protein [Pirellulaceae bacterium]
MVTYNMNGSVGYNGRNSRDDVIYVQNLLNRFIGPHGMELKKLVDDGICGSLTRGAIKEFQQIYCGFQYPDRRVDPGRTTHQKLLGPIDQPRLSNPHELSLQSVIQTLRDSQVGQVKFTMKGISIGFQDYYVVSKRLSDRQIPVFHDSSKGNSAEYFHKNVPPIRGYMVIGFREAANVLQRSVVVHEATHAALDLRGVQMWVSDSEAISYLAQAMYYYSVTGRDFLASEVGPSAAALTQAVEIARRIRETNTPQVTAQEEQDLMVHVRALPTVTPGTYFKYDG